jgi:HPt (histidine-containing phosphotransfer) domain-containing protein
LKYPARHFSCSVGFIILIFVLLNRSGEMEYTIFKPEYLLSISGGDREIMAEIAGIFGNQVPEFMTGMRNLLREEKYLELGLLAHKAKGSVTVLGMDETAKMLKEFELLAKAGDQKERYEGFIAMFEADSAKVMEEVNDYLGKII